MRICSPILCTSLAAGRLSLLKVAQGIYGEETRAQGIYGEEKAKKQAHLHGILSNEKLASQIIPALS